MLLHIGYYWETPQPTAKKADWQSAKSRQLARMANKHERTPKFIVKLPTSNNPNQPF